MAAERLYPPVSHTSQTIRLLEQSSTSDSTAHLILKYGRQVFSPEGFTIFLETPLDEFDGRTAQQMIESGEAEQVLQFVAAEFDGQGF